MDTWLLDSNTEVSKTGTISKRYDGVRKDGDISEVGLESLIPRLDDDRLIATTTALLDRNGFDWRVFCTKKTVKALRKAMTSCHGICETVLLEEAFLAIACDRPDLRPCLIKCLPAALKQDAQFDSSLLMDAVRIEQSA